MPSRYPSATALVPAWATTTMRRSGSTSFHTGGSSEIRTAPAWSIHVPSPVTTRWWKCAEVLAARQAVPQLVDRSGPLLGEDARHDVGGRAVPRRRADLGQPVDRRGRPAEPLDEGSGGLLGPAERRHPQLVDLEIGHPVCQRLSLAPPPLGERRVVDGEAVTGPFGFAVADEHDLHAGRAYCPARPVGRAPGTEPAIRPRGVRWWRASQQPRCQCRRRSGASTGTTTRWKVPNGMSRVHRGRCTPWWPDRAGSGGPRPRGPAGRSRTRSWSARGPSRPQPTTAHTTRPTQMASAAPTST